MDDSDFSLIEERLGIRVPTEYRNVMPKRRPELISLALDYRPELDDLEPVFLTTKDVIHYNEVMRDPDYGTTEPYPDWWQTFFMVGTNGGGDFYCLRLDESPGVWMIGSDCGETPTLTHASLDALAAEQADHYREEMSEPERAVGVAAIGEEDWAALKAASTGVADLGEKFRDFYQDQQRRFEKARESGKNVWPVFIRAPEFLEWCSERGVAPDAASRDVFAAEKFPQDHPWIGKYQRRARGA